MSLDISVLHVFSWSGCEGGGVDVCESTVMIFRDCIFVFPKDLGMVSVFTRAGSGVFCFSSSEIGLEIICCSTFCSVMTWSAAWALRVFDSDETEISLNDCIMLFIACTSLVDIPTVHAEFLE